MDEVRVDEAVREPGWQGGRSSTGLAGRHQATASNDK
jgi:hypothetical protein